MLVDSAMLWLKYGLLVDDLVLAIANGIGVMTSLFSILVFYNFCSDKVRIDPGELGSIMNI